MSNNKKPSLALTNCNANHEPVWFYDDKLCPICEAKALVEDLESDLQDMREQLFDTEVDVERLRGRLSELEDE